MSLDPTLASPSRVNALLTCGVAFRMKYVDGLPEARSGSAALRGSVLHKALEWWAPDRSQALRPLVDKAWLDVTGNTAVFRFLTEYQSLSRQAIALEQQIRAARPDIKKVRATKDWKTSGVCKDIERLVREWLPRLKEHSPWQFSESDPLPSIYDETIQWASTYQARAESYPNTWHTEFGFEENWRGFTIKGYIDSIEPLVDLDTGSLTGLGVVDYKSYAKAPSQHKDYRQCVMYAAALLQLLERGAIQLPVDWREVPLYVGIDYLRWSHSWQDEKGQPFPARRFWSYKDDDFNRLETELRHYKGIVEGGYFLPAQKNTNPDFCPYPDACCLSSCAEAGGAAELLTV